MGEGSAGAGGDTGWDVEGGGDGASDAFLIFGLLEKFFSFVVEGDRSLIFTALGENVGFDALALREEFEAAQDGGDLNRGIGEDERVGCVNAEFLHGCGVQFGDDVSRHE